MIKTGGIQMKRRYGFLIFLFLSVVSSSLLSANGAFVPTIGIYSGSGADPYLQAIAHRMFRWMELNTVSINAHQINQNDFEGIQMLYFPGGSTPPIRREITETGREHLRTFVRTGGGYMGTCAGALMACEKNIWRGNDDNYGLFNLIAATGIGPIPELDDGDGVMMAELKVNQSSTIGLSYPETAWVLSINSPYFEVHPDRSIIVIAEYAANRKPAYIASTYGEGRIFLTGPHPEFEEDNNRDGNSYFDSFDDQGSDWDLVKSAVYWCLENLMDSLPKP